MGTSLDFVDTSFICDGCTRYMSDWYRDSSVYLAVAVALGDAIGYLRCGRIASAAKRASEPARASAAALLRERRMLHGHARTGARQNGG